MNLNLNFLFYDLRDNSLVHTAFFSSSSVLGVVYEPSQNAVVILAEMTSSYRFILFDTESMTEVHPISFEISKDMVTTFSTGFLVHPFEKKAQKQISGSNFVLMDFAGTFAVWKVFARQISNRADVPRNGLILQITSALDFNHNIFSFAFIEFYWNDEDFIAQRPGEMEEAYGKSNVQWLFKFKYSLSEMDKGYQISVFFEASRIMVEREDDLVWFGAQMHHLL